MNTMQFNPSDCPHRRYNPLTGQWVLVSPHRAKRPWSGRDEKPAVEKLPHYDAGCFLCPTNTRVSGEVNPNYEGTYVFQNDHGALLADACAQPKNQSELFQAQSVSGVSRVICFSPDHSKTLPELSLPEIGGVITTWQQQISELSERYTWIQAFENKGEIMGCSQPHPHGQIWASDFLPNEIERKNHFLSEYYQRHGTNLLMDYVNAERQDGSRIVVETEHWVALVPYWAAWPFETLLLPKQHIKRMDEMNDAIRLDLGVALKKLTCRYDNLFECSFPYSMGWHFAPYFKEDKNIEHWQLHALFYPPLLRSATVKKFMVGYEMLAETQRDLTPEQAAQRLRDVSDRHYKQN
ncbi:UDP-glucose--hexose-1-phosphate uridylyltransferase [Providencia rettgeri]|uniref:UDP-glucose--hexose-1-phosphate uridylyltransferase n=1 Tax=Providencia rettgeri TaxID=587 RepID=UPI0023AA63E6|nr:UDP-glucose--hexose-1-phosphate uridylyltransferase [Providencia rettgeri]